MDLTLREFCDQLVGLKRRYLRDKVQRPRFLNLKPGLPGKILEKVVTESFNDDLTRLGFDNNKFSIQVSLPDAECVHIDIVERAYDTSFQLRHNIVTGETEVHSVG